MKFTGEGIELRLSVEHDSTGRHMLYQAAGTVVVQRKPRLGETLWLDAIDKRFSGRVLVDSVPEEVGDGVYKCVVVTTGQVLFDGVPLHIHAENAK